jgi:IS5 family transposase
MSKDKYKVRNWQDYNEGLKGRGSLFLWVQADIADQWKHKGQSHRGAQKEYSDVAIELCLIIRKVYKLPFRQTEGFMASFFKSAGFNLSVPDYTTMNRRSNGLNVDLSASKKETIIDIVVDSTGLKVYGEGEWKVRKYGAGKHRTWMKLHLAAEASTQQIEAVTLTTNSIDDATEVTALLGQIQTSVRSFTGDGAYDKIKVRRTLYERKVRQIIPPQHNAVTDRKCRKYLQARDKTIDAINKIGKEKWKKKTGYHQRSKAETAMFRYKTIVGDSLSARKFGHQLTEVKIGCKILNLALQTAKPLSFKCK